MQWIDKDISFLRGKRCRRRIKYGSPEKKGAETTDNLLFIFKIDVSIPSYNEYFLSAGNIAKIFIILRWKLSNDFQNEILRTMRTTKAPGKGKDGTDVLVLLADISLFLKPILRTLTKQKNSHRRSKKNAQEFRENQFLSKHLFSKLIFRSKFRNHSGNETDFPIARGKELVLGFLLVACDIYWLSISHAFQHGIYRFMSCKWISCISRHMFYRFPCLRVGYISFGILFRPRCREACSDLVNSFTNSPLWKGVVPCDRFSLSWADRIDDVMYSKPAGMTRKSLSRNRPRHELNPVSPNF